MYCHLLPRICGFRVYRVAKNIFENLIEGFWSSFVLRNRRHEFQA